MRSPAIYIFSLFSRDLSVTAGPVVNGESSTFHNQMSSNEKFGDSYEQLRVSPEDSEENENEYSGSGIVKDDDKNLTYLIPRQLMLCQIQPT